MNKDADYYREREQTERAAADATSDSKIRQIHIEMAEAYSRLADLQTEKLSLFGRPNPS